MKRFILVFATAFALSASFGALGSGCSSNDCNCPALPARPEPQGPLSDLSVQSFDETGELAELLVKPASGTLEVTRDAVAIVYQQDGVEHRVSYAVTGPR